MAETSMIMHLVRVAGYAMYRALESRIIDHIESVEGELSLIKELSNEIGQRPYHEDGHNFQEFALKLNGLVNDADDVLGMFATKSGQWRLDLGVLNWRKADNKLKDIWKRMIDISKTAADLKPKDFVFNVTPDEEASSSSTNFSRLLDDEASWTLFTGKLMVGIAPKSKLMEVGKEIVMKCGGLEPQISKVCDLLSDQDVPFTHEAWTKVLEGPEFNDAQTHNWSKTLHKINNISPPQRRCLFYFVHFPAEFGIPVRRLIVLWVAEGLISHSEGEDPPERVAESYLEEFIDRNIVQVAKRMHNGKVKTCRLPSALRQHLLTKANEFIFLQNRTITSTDSTGQQKMSIVSRVADRLHNDDICNKHIHGDSTDSSTLRTYYKNVLSFLSFDTREGSKPGQQVGKFLKRCISSDCFLLLKVLDLEGVYKPKLPKRIKRLTLLTYLGLRGTYLESLPSSISKLLKLQTLDLKHTYIHILPTSIWKMELRHLFLSETYRTKFPPQPKGNSLSDLQTLWGLFIDKETIVNNGLDKLVNIKKLGLTCQSMSLKPTSMTTKLEEVADWITKLKHLQKLRLKSRNEEGGPWMLHLRSFENNKNLTDMYLLGSLSNSSVPLSEFPRSLIELTLSHSELMEDPLQILETFPNLQTLCLLADSYIGKTMVCKSQSFPKLLVLKFWKLGNLEAWKIEPGALPSLQSLEIRSCPRLKMLPDGLKHVNTLLELKLPNMPKEINAEAHNIPPRIIINDPFPIQTSPSTTPFPYKFISKLELNPLVSEPNLELLRDLIYNDILRIYKMKDELVMPQELSRAVEELNLKFIAATEELNELSLGKLRENLPELIQKIGQAIERADMKLLTDFHHWPQQELQQATEETIIMSSLEETTKKDKGKDVIVDKSPERLEDQVQQGSSSGTSEALKIQEELASQKVKQEALEEQLNTLAKNQQELTSQVTNVQQTVSNVSEKQEAMEVEMKSMGSNIQAILAILQKQQKPNP